MSRALQLIYFYEALKEKQDLKREIQKEKRKHRRKWSRNIVKLHRTLMNIKKDKQLVLSEIKTCLSLRQIEAEQLYHILIPSIEDQHKPNEDDIKPRQMLVMTLKYLTGKENIPDLAEMYDVDADVVKNIVINTCRAVYSCLKHYYKLPNDEEEWKIIAEQFKKLRNFPNCVGATILKHVAITKPKDYAQAYLNKNGHYSQIIYAFVNAKYELFYLEIGFEGSLNGDDVFCQSKFFDKIFNECLFFPPPTVIGDFELPYVVVADNSFMVNGDVMVPYLEEELENDEQKLFYERWAYAKRVADDAFELMESKFKILNRTIDLDVKDVYYVIYACTSLHNYMIRNINSYKVVENENKVVNVSREEALVPDGYEFGSEVRDNFVKYFSLECNVTKTDSLKTNVTETECLGTNVTETECLGTNVTESECFKTNVIETERLGTNVITESECLEMNVVKTESSKSN